MAKKRQTLSDGLRQKLRQRLGVCPTCGAATMGLREAARASGTSPATLSRFLRGHAAGSGLLDALDAWLGQEPRKS
jgi:hypothetical protein